MREDAYGFKEKVQDEYKNTGLEIDLLADKKKEEQKNNNILNDNQNIMNEQHIEEPLQENQVEKEIQAVQEHMPPRLNKDIKRDIPKVFEDIMKNEHKDEAYARGLALDTYAEENLRYYDSDVYKQD
ncbi:MAG: hypothetical protein J6N76_00140, partial [Lachnospiraceae bacterium]|nr:hypothetical protein [Lachnospiraceae bacterium]